MATSACWHTVYGQLVLSCPGGIEKSYSNNMANKTEKKKNNSIENLGKSLISFRLGYFLGIMFLLFA